MIGAIFHLWESGKALVLSAYDKSTRHLPSHRFQAMASVKPGPGTTALKAVADAEANVGVREVGNNAGKYVETYLRAVGLGAGNPWCQAFVCYRLITAAQELGQQIPSDYPRSGYTPTAADWGKKKGLWIPVADAISGRERPIRGDLAYFYMPNMGRIAHVGMVAEVTEAGVVTIEGNTSGGSGTNRDGGGVWRKSRSWESLGKFGGFVRLPF